MESPSKKRKREEIEHIIPPTISFTDAIKQGKLLDVKKWITLGANVNTISSYDTPLCLAVKVPEPMGVRLVSLLLDAKAEPNLDPEKNKYVIPPLTTAIALGRSETVKLLLTAKANPNQVHGRYSPLMLAVAGGQLNMVKTLLRYNAKPEDRPRPELFDYHIKNGTALSLAITNEPYQGEVVAALLEAKADVKQQQNGQGEQLLHIAAAAGKLDAVHRLLKENADIDARTLYGGQTPLHSAVCNVHVDVVKALLEARANVDAVMHGGRTSLHCFVRGPTESHTQLKLKKESFNELLQCLFEAKINSNAVDEQGDTALSVALKHLSFYSSAGIPHSIGAENSLASLLEQLKKHDAKFRDYIEATYEQAKKYGAPQKIIQLLAKFANRRAISFFAGLHLRTGYAQDGRAPSTLAQVQRKRNSIFDVRALRVALELGDALLPQEKNESQDSAGTKRTL